MSAVDWKTLISFVSAIVAVVSAFIAYRAKVQTRTDIFESQRDALILVMADNDNRCSHLKIQAAMARDQVEGILSKFSDEEMQAEATALFGNIAAVQKVTKSLDDREYNQENLDELKYTEESLAILRRMARGEQLNAKLLAAETYDLLFNHIKHFVSRYEGRT